MKRERGRAAETRNGDTGSANVPGIVIADGRGARTAVRPPRIQAFVWGGRLPSAPTLPYGRWKAPA